jgi:hypothetical protein
MQPIATKRRTRATAEKAKAPLGVTPAALRSPRSEERYFFFFALALVFAPALATFAVFFFAAIVSTSPNSGMLLALRRFSKL